MKIRDGGLSKFRRCSLDRLDQRLRRERLCEIGEATGFQRSFANGGVVVPSDVDDRHQNSSSLETTPQLDPGFILEVDVHDDTQRFFEIIVVLKSLGRWKQGTVVTVCPQQSLYSPEHTRVVIDDKNDILIWHRHPGAVRRHNLRGLQKERL